MSGFNNTGQTGLVGQQDRAQFQNEMAGLIGRIAEYVAANGPESENQLRSLDPDGQTFPFLYADSQHAPYYQWMLAEASERLNAENTAASLIDANWPINDDAAATSVQTARLPTPIQPAPVNPQDVEIFNLARNEDPQSSRMYNQHLADVGPAQGHSYPPLSRATSQAPSATASMIGGQFTPEPIVPYRSIQPYNYLQEVHILDSNGTDLSGLNTFIVIKVNEPSAQQGDPGNTQYQEPYYSVCPNGDTIFRLSHHCLLPAGFPLGAEVKQKGSYLPSLVMKRIVVGGQRFYDVKDELESVYTFVREDDLEPHTGGSFRFRLPRQLS